MTLRAVDLPADVPGRLWLGAMPGRFQSWPAFQNDVRNHRLAMVVCLTPLNEMAELAPAYSQAVGRGELPFRWLHLPMRNFGLPEDVPLFRREVLQIAQALRRGDSVMLHCAAGIGRTGSTAACVLKALGVATEDSLTRVRQAGSNPENALQSGLVDQF